MLDVRDLTVALGGKTIVRDVSFSVCDGQWLMLVGPNGAGKSTVVSAVSRSIPYVGRVTVAGVDIQKSKPAELARKMAVLTQKHYVGYDFTVEEVVSLGRYAHGRGMLSARTDEDETHIAHALSLTGMTELRNQSVLTLSGGELQRTFLAQVFAQDPCLLILDEPTNHLDLKYQQQIFDLIREWLKTSGRAVMSVVHDLSLARAYGSHALLMAQGSVLACGAMDEVFSPDKLARAFDMDVPAWMRGLLAQW